MQRHINVIVVVLLSLMASLTHSQTPQTTADCSKGCNFAADPAQDGSVVSCVLYGLPGAALSKPIIDSATITPKPPGTLQPKTCWWAGVVFPLGTYVAYAMTLAADGRASGPSIPLTIVPPPLPMPANVRIPQ